jgi:hypothetical protein
MPRRYNCDTEPAEATMPLSWLATISDISHRLFGQETPAFTPGEDWPPLLSDQASACTWAYA